MSTLTVTEVNEIPKTTRTSGGSKYAEVFEATRSSATGVTAISFEDEKTAAGRSGYLRRIAPEGFVVSQRGSDVYVALETAVSDDV